MAPTYDAAAALSMPYTQMRCEMEGRMGCDEWGDMGRVREKKHLRLQPLLRGPLLRVDVARERRHRHHLRERLIVDERHDRAKRAKELARHRVRRREHRRARVVGNGGERYGTDDLRCGRAPLLERAQRRAYRHH